MRLFCNNKINLLLTNTMLIDVPVSENPTQLAGVYARILPIIFADILDAKIVYVRFIM